MKGLVSFALTAVLGFAAISLVSCCSKSEDLHHHKHHKEHSKMHQEHGDK